MHDDLLNAVNESLGKVRERCKAGRVKCVTAGTNSPAGVPVLQK